MKKRMARTLVSLGLSTALMIGVSGGVLAAFQDVPEDSSYATAVDSLTQKGIAKGVGENQFLPEAALTKAALVTFLGRMAGVSDIASSDWANGYIHWAAEQGLIDTEEGQGDGLTASEVHTILERFCTLNQVETVALPDSKDELVSRGEAAIALDAIDTLMRKKDTSSEIVTHTQQEKARTVITTDGEVDDMNSVLRALLYANDMDICGIVLTSSMYHYAGDLDAGIEPFRWTGTQWIQDFLDDYAEVYDNLKAHDSEYPEPEYLRSVTHIGNISNKGEMDKVTDGSEFLKELFLDDDDRTLYVQTWGGTNTTARALKSIEEEYKGTEEWEAIQKKINDKVVLYIILDQDESYSNYIASSWPELQILNDRSNFWHFAYAWQYHSDALNDTLKAEWNQANLMGEKGALMENYALMGDGRMIEGELYEEQRGTDDYLAANPTYERYDFISEGDSPSFLYLIDTGLRSMEDPSYGGWGGRFGQVSDSLYQNTVLDYEEDTAQYEAQYTLSRWFPDIQNDFANRVDWCTTADDSAVNHAPTVEVLEGIDLDAAPGETVTLTAKAEDPDGDQLTYRWWRYFEADTYQDSEPETEPVNVDAGMLLNITRKPGENEVLDKIPIINSDQAQMSFTVPEDAKSGDTIHMIIEVQDNGAHMLKHYQRVIITVQE